MSARKTFRTSASENVAQAEKEVEEAVEGINPHKEAQELMNRLQHGRPIFEVDVHAHPSFKTSLIHCFRHWKETFARFFSPGMVSNIVASSGSKTRFLPSTKKSSQIDLLNSSHPLQLVQDV